MCVASWPRRRRIGTQLAGALQIHCLGIEYAHRCSWQRYIFNSCSRIIDEGRQRCTRYALCIEQLPVLDLELQRPFSSAELCQGADW